MLRYLTAGESHGPRLTAILEGVPAGLPITEERINVDLSRRQGGYGRGGRMLIERDRVELLSGVRWGKTMGSPITLSVTNLDWENWTKKMSVKEEDRDDSIVITRPRPGHADLGGIIKYDAPDVRNILERSSARETAARVAVGAVARALLQQLGVRVHGFVAEAAGVASARPDLPVADLVKLAEASEMFTYDREAETAMKAAIDHAREEGDTVGGVVEVVVTGLPPGIGSYVQWDRKLDARLAMALISVQAFKGVEFGLGFDVARLPGSRVHDEIFYDAQRVSSGATTAYYRLTNNAGGIEGGMTNGEEVVVRAAMKPIPTLYRPLRSVDVKTHEAFEATVERSDCCAVPAAAVVAEAVVAIEIANAVLEKTGGDSMAEVTRNWKSYLECVSRA